MSESISTLLKINDTFRRSLFLRLPVKTAKRDTYFHQSDGLVANLKSSYQLL
jgi:hypothetical protein